MSLDVVFYFIQRPIDVVKIDIEHWEWPALNESLGSGVLNDIKILDLELHSWVILKGKYVMDPDEAVYMGYLKILRSLHQMGFRLYLARENNNCRFKSRTGVTRSSCQEIGFIKLKK